MNSIEGDNRLKLVEKVSDLLDSKFVIPGSKFRFGFDPIIGLIPVLGDLSTFVISSLLLRTIAKHGASNKVILLMSINILVDALFGAIPILGNIFDFFYKSNQRNVKLLKEHYELGKHQGSGKDVLAIVIIVFIILFAALVFGIYKLYQFIASYF